MRTPTIGLTIPFTLLSMISEEKGASAIYRPLVSTQRGPSHRAGEDVVFRSGHPATIVSVRTTEERGWTYVDGDNPKTNEVLCVNCHRIRWRTGRRRTVDDEKKRLARIPFVNAPHAKPSNGQYEHEESCDKPIRCWYLPAKNICVRNRQPVCPRA